MKIDNVADFTAEYSGGGFNIFYRYSTTDTETKKKSMNKCGNAMVLRKVDKEVCKAIETIIEFLETNQMNKYE